MNQQKKKVPFGAKLVLITLTAGLLVGGISAAAYTTFQYLSGAMDIKKVLDSNKEESKQPEVTLGKTKTLDTTADHSNVSTVAKKAMSSIVSISSTYQQTNPFYGTTEQYTGCGSGIIIDKTGDTLSIATNKHVVKDATSITVTFIDGKSVNASVKGTDSTADLALVTLSLDKLDSDTQNAITTATFGKSSEMETGQGVIAIGNSLGYGQSVTVGCVSALNREVTIDSTTMTLIQTDAAINPGNSGGALLNMNGEVIGINSAKYSDDSVEGMGFAIPIDSATPILSDIKTKKEVKEGEEGYLGISGRTISESLSQAYNMPVGVYIGEVSESGAAKEAGLKKGDIITKISGRDVKTIEHLQELVNSYSAGTKIQVTFSRNLNGSYEEESVTVTLKGSDTLNELQ
ncbi:MAG: trypsin-like peptidase domain-containing protein [Clostridiales bacterium]|nr:trypsin-like peptidase domain-containing protein [Clostridiales bacterium]